MLIKNHFILFPFCIPIKGKNDSLLIDFNLKRYLKIDSDIYSTIIKLHERDFESINYRSTSINDLLKYLHEEKFGFFSSNPNLYPMIETSLDFPNKIRSAVIEVSNNNFHHLYSFIQKIVNLQCSRIEFWLSDYNNLDRLLELIYSFNNSSIRTITILVDLKQDSFQESIIKSRINHLPKIEYIVFYNGYNVSTSNRIIITNQDLKRINYGKNSYSILNLNLNFYFESLQFNTFLYKKICVDNNGFIKNFLSFTENYGNISDNVDIEKLIDSLSFKKHWFVTNDLIIDIKDSPLRYNYMITDELIQDGKFYKIKNTYSNYPWNKIK